VSVQDRCMVCARHTIGSEIILDAHDGTTSDGVQLEAIQDRCMVCTERTIGSEIPWAHPMNS
jgi:hypothetical protein